MQNPSVSRDVHYVSYGTPGGEFPSVCRAAKVTEVDPADPARVGLVVLNPTGLFFHPLAAGGSKHHDGSGQPADPACTAPHEGGPHRYCSCGWTEPTLRGGTWHWPERVD